MTDDVKTYLAEIGRRGGAKGGKASGAAKVRGDAAYYSRIGKKSAASRKAQTAPAGRCFCDDHQGVNLRCPTHGSDNGDGASDSGTVTKGK
jgi:hypothetical protein